MKKTIKLSLIFLLVIISASFTFKEDSGQSTNFPPIQNYLEKMNGKNVTNGSGKVICVSQIVTENSYTLTTKVGTFWKYESTGINWKSYKRMYYTNLKNEKYQKVHMEFNDEFEETIFNDDETKMKSPKTHLTFYILYKDKEAFYKIMEDWKNEK